MYSFRDFHEAGTAEQVARAEFYQGAIDASIAQKASRRADSRLLFLALCWAATVPELPPCPDELKPWGPDSPDTIPEEPPSGKTGKAASDYFRMVCQHLENWPRTSDGSPVGPESVVRRPSEATVAFLAGLDESESAAIRALASAAVRFGDRTRQRAASGSRKGKGKGEGTADAKGKGEGTADAASGPRKPNLDGLNQAERAAVLIQYAAECAEALMGAASDAETACFGYAATSGTPEANEAHAALVALCRKADAALKAAKLAADRAKASNQ